MTDSVFTKLNGINVEDHIEEKNGLRYLSWSWAWSEVKKAFPNARYTIYEATNGWNYFTDGRTCWVKTGVEIDGLEYIEYLPIMDYKNKSIPLEQVTSMDVNKSIQRSLTKACARHGLGLYVYAGEDLPEDETIAMNQSTYVTKLKNILRGRKDMTLDMVTNIIYKNSHKKIYELTEEEWASWERWINKKLNEIDGIGEKKTTVNNTIRGGNGSNN